MNFGQKQMEKYGWKEGDGLGKTNQGLVNPIKANLKFDNAGLGFDRASDFNNHWWERVFNEAATNIVVDTKKNGISMSLKDQNAVEINTNSYSVRKFKEIRNQGGEKYSNLLKVSTLTKSGLEDNTKVEKNLDSIELPKMKVLTDEELFKACGGRTAHKGARHGIVQAGKLSRLAEQDRHLTDSLKNNPESSPSDLYNSWIPTKSKKKRKSAIVERHQEDEPDFLSEMVDNESEYSRVKSRGKKRDKKKMEEEISSNLSSFSLGDDSGIPGGSGTTQQNTDSSLIAEDIEFNKSHNSNEKISKKKKKKNRNKSKNKNIKEIEKSSPIESKIGTKRKADSLEIVRNYRNKLILSEDSDSDKNDEHSPNLFDIIPISNNCFDKLKTYKTLDDLTKIPSKKRRIHKDPVAGNEDDNLKDSFSKKHAEKAEGKIPIVKKTIKKRKTINKNIKKLAKSIQKFDISANNDD